MTDSRHQGHAAPSDTLRVRKPSRMATLGTMAEATVPLMTP